MIIKIVDYNENWPLKYSVEANEIRNAVINNLISIYHIGSTAIKEIRASISLALIDRKSVV